MLILTLGGGTMVRGGRAPCRSHLFSRENSWVQSHHPAGVNKSNQQCHGHSKGSILAIFLTKHAQFFLWETNKDLPVKVLHVAATSPFKTLLEAQSYLGHRQKFWERYAKLPIIGCAEWEVTTWTSRNPFICSHPDTCGSCAWEYFNARPVPVGK